MEMVPWMLKILHRTINANKGQLFLRVSGAYKCSPGFGTDRTSSPLDIALKV